MSDTDDISKLRAGGVKDADIALHYKEKLQAGGISDADISTWLNEQGLGVGITAQTGQNFGPQLDPGSPQDFFRTMLNQSPGPMGEKELLAGIGAGVAPVLVAPAATAALGAIATRFLPQLVLKAMAAGGGAFGGSMVGQQLESGQASTEEAIRDSLGAMVGDVGGAGAGSVLTRLAAPARGNVDEAGRMAIQLGREEGIPLSPTETTSGWMPKALNVLAEGTMGGVATKRAFQRNTVAKITEHARKALDDLGVPSEVAAHEAGSVMGAALDAPTAPLYLGYDKALNTIAAENRDMLWMPKTAQMLGELWQEQKNIIAKAAKDGFKKVSSYEINNKALNETFKYLDITDEGMKKQLQMFMLPERGDVMTGKDAKFMMAKVFGGWDSKLAPASMRLREGLKGAMIDDLEMLSGNTDTFRQAKEFGDKAFKAIFGRDGFFENNLPAMTAKKMYEKSPGGTFAVLKKIKDPDVMLGIKNFVSQQPAMLSDSGEVMGPSGTQAWELFKLAYVGDIFERSTVKDSGVFKPEVFSRLVTEYRDIIKSAMPEMWPALQREASLAGAVAKDFRQGAEHGLPLIPAALQTIGLFTESGRTVEGFLVPNGLGAAAALALSGPQSRITIRRWLEQEALGKIGRGVEPVTQQVGRMFGVQNAQKDQ